MPLHNNKNDSAHFSSVEKKAMKVQSVLDNLITDIVQNALLSSSGTSDGVFSFDSHPRLRRYFNSIVKQVSEKMVKVINDQTKDSWARGSKKSIDAVIPTLRNNSVLLKAVKNSSEINLNALQSFQKRKTNGMTLSDRVWNITKTFKQELEFALDLSIAEGKSAQDISKEVRKLLKNPTKASMMIRDKHGNKTMKKLEKGVYQSSYKNAMRLARTENNIAYHSSSYEKYNEFDFVVGIEVRLSNNLAHCPFCQSMAGKYPKDFKFTGWHPQCRCSTIPILKTQDELQRDNDALAEGKAINPSSVNEVKTPNKTFMDYIALNKDKIEGLKNKPYFFTDNQKYININSAKSTPLYDKELLELRITNEQSNEIFMRKKELELERQDLNELFDLLGADENPTLGDLLKTKRGEKIFDILGIKSNINKSVGEFSGVKLSFDEIYEKFDISVFDGWERAGNTAVGQIQSMLGFKGLPKTLKQIDFDDIIGEEVVTIYRGVNNAIQVEQFKFGDMYDGIGIFGNGSYFSNLKETGLHYAKDNVEAVIEAKINLKESRVIDYNKLSKEHSIEREKALQKSGGIFSDKDALFWSDPATYAAAKGYDVIYVPQGKNEDFYVILNRTKLWVKK